MRLRRGRDGCRNRRTGDCSSLAGTAGDRSAVELARPSNAPAAAFEAAARPAPRAGSGANRPATLANVFVALNNNAAAVDGATLALNGFGQALNRVADEPAQHRAELSRILDAIPTLSGAGIGASRAFTTYATIHEAPVETADHPAAPTATGGASAGPTAGTAGALVLRR